MSESGGHRRALGEIGVIAVVLLTIAWRAQRVVPPQALPQIDHQRAEAWMADCLPGIGPARREAAAAALRAGDCTALPARARPLAEVLFTFSGPAEPASGR